LSTSSHVHSGAHSLQASSLMKLGFGVLIAWGQTPNALAQYAPRNPNDAAGALTASYVKTGLYVISGGGSNTVLRLSGNGLILVNGKYAENYDELRRRVRKIVDQPIRVDINTDHYANHNGTNGKFTAEGIQVIAQQNVARHLHSQQSSETQLSPPAWTYENEKTLQFGPVTVQLLHFAAAHTDGDTIVYFPDLKAAALGALYSTDPMPDYSAGGSLAGWKDGLNQILKLDFDVAIPDSGPAVSRADVQALRDRINLLISRGKAVVMRGTPKDKLVSQLKVADPSWSPSLSGDQLDHLFGELSGRN
jgi:cyclase